MQEPGEIIIISSKSVFLDVFVRVGKNMDCVGIVLSCADVDPECL